MQHPPKFWKYEFDDMMLQFYIRFMHSFSYQMLCVDVIYPEMNQKVNDCLLIPFRIGYVSPKFYSVETLTI